jgi:hypothetical protein
MQERPGGGRLVVDGKSPEAEDEVLTGGADNAASETVPPPPGPGPTLQGAGGPKKPARYGLTVRFESRPDDPALGRLVESTVWVNEAHPAYRRAIASRSEGYHVALTVAMTLAPLAVEPPFVHEFVNAFLSGWGKAGKGS